MVLLILAGVSISSINNGSGVVEKAAEAKDNWNETNEKQQTRMDELTNMNKKMNPVTE